jgi:Fe-S-cluster-containing dehydrogenase component/DMSO reductase anchor subunit
LTLLSAVDPVGPTPVDEYIALQAELTAVERFARRHDDEPHALATGLYRDLIPLTAPGPGEQYGFEVDLDSCTGCKACVAACHSLNGLDEGESWRSVTVITGVADAKPFRQTVTSACHHCVDPACLNGCPANAYEKDPVTGIVSHLDDQCIGCSYCTLTCPYEVPVFSDRLGIVRKCDMCTGRLQAGEAPACVQGCPNSAIAIRVVPVAQARRNADRVLVPGAPPSSITIPSTTYRSARRQTLFEQVAMSRPMGREVATCSEGARSAHPHTPLAVMLVLTQLAVGAFVGDVVMARGASALDAAIAVGASAIAMAASVFHLGRPRYFYRAVLGVRHSWLSREVIAFGAFTGLATLYACLLAGGTPHGALTNAVGFGASLAGIVGVVCSALIYAVTHRASWRLPSVLWNFVLTCAVCGAATLLAVSTVADRRLHDAATLLVVAMTLKLVGEAAVFVRGDREARRRARVLTDHFGSMTVSRFAFGLLGGIALPLVAHNNGPGASVAAALVLAGELVARSLFFTTASPPR